MCATDALRLGKSASDLEAAGGIHCGIFITRTMSARPRSTDATPRPRRSVLYRLGVDRGAYEAAATLHPDVLLFEIEDSVPTGDKHAARTMVARTLAAGGFRRQELLVTVNALDTPWGHEDLAALARAPLHGIVLPKTDGPETVRAAERVLVAHGAPPELRLWAMIETPRGLARVQEIATATPRLAGLTVGLGDLSRGLNAYRRPAPNRWPLVPALAAVVLAARANGLAALDSSFREPRDKEGFRAACLASRELGFDGKVFEDPALIAVANEAFAPTPEEVAWADRVMAARPGAGERRILRRRRPYRSAIRGAGHAHPRLSRRHRRRRMTPRRRSAFRAAARIGVVPGADHACDEAATCVGNLTLPRRRLQSSAGGRCATMARIDIRKRLATGEPMVLDGAMGSELQRRNVWVSHGSTADRLGAWSATAMRDAPEVVREVHEDYFKAGADIATTNSFWTNSLKLGLVGLGDKAAQYTRQAAEIAVEARNRLKPEVYVAGSMAPPRGRREPPDPVDLPREFAMQARALKEGGVDFLLVEYIGYVVDITTAIDTISPVGLPIMIGVRHVTPEGDMEHGETWEELVHAIGKREVAALLLMCSKPPAISAGLPKLRKAFKGPIGAYPGVGYTPRAGGFEKGGQFHGLDTTSYTPQNMADDGKAWLAMGAQIVGGCCATTPDHIAALRKVVPQAKTG
jgi:citrate lyase subunit beta/citryl-CoA lyase